MSEMRRKESGAGAGGGTWRRGVVLLCCWTVGAWLALPGKVNDGRGLGENYCVKCDKYRDTSLPVIDKG